MGGTRSAAKRKRAESADGPATRNKSARNAGTTETEDKVLEQPVKKERRTTSAERGSEQQQGQPKKQAIRGSQDATKDEPQKVETKISTADEGGRDGHGKKRETSRPRRVKISKQGPTDESDSAVPDPPEKAQNRNTSALERRGEKGEASKPENLKTSKKRSTSGGMDNVKDDQPRKSGRGKAASQERESAKVKTTRKMATVKSDAKERDQPPVKVRRRKSADLQGGEEPSKKLEASKSRKPTKQAPEKVTDEFEVTAGGGKSMDATTRPLQHTEDGSESDEHGPQTSYFDAMASDGRYATSMATIEVSNIEIKDEGDIGPPADGMGKLMDDHETQLFRQWNKFVASSRSVLVLGLGSKRRLLTSFAEQQHSTHDVTVIHVNGFNPNANAKLVFKELMALVSEDRKGALPPLSASFEKLALSLDSELEEDVLLVIHNLDGTGLRARTDQLAIALLASECSRVKLIASVDHVNAFQLWDSLLWHQFDWCVQAATTFESYTVERKYSVTSTAEVFRKGSSTLASEEKKVRGAVMLLKSLSSNANGIFRILAEEAGEGLTEQRLFDVGRDRFLVTNKANLRSILTEMSSHELIRNVRDKQGDKIVINLTLTQLDAVLKQSADLAS